MSDEKFWKNKEIMKKYIILTKEDYIKEELAIPWLINNIRHLDLINKKIIDLGCGNGYFTNKLFKHLKDKAEIVGVDFSEHLINYAKRNYPHFKFFIHDLRVEFPKEYMEYFDYTVSLTTLMDIDDIEKVIENISKILKKNAKLAIVVVHPLYNLIVNSIRSNNSMECERKLVEIGKKYVMEESIKAKFSKLIEEPVIVYRRPEGSYINTLTKNGFRIEEVSYLIITESLAQKYEKLKDKEGFPVFYCIKAVKM